MQTVQVTRYDDINDPNDGLITLREAVALTATPAFPGPDFIELNGIATINSPIQILQGNSLFFRPSASATQRVGVDGRGNTSLFIIEQQDPGLNVVFEGVLLQNGFAQGNINAGALHLRPGADVLIRQGAGGATTNFINNGSRGSGGAIFVSEGATLNFDFEALARFQGNQADGLGGGIFVSQGGTVNFGGGRSAVFSDNSATRGGGFFVDPNGRATQLTDTQLGNQNNTATDGDPFSNTIPTFIAPANFGSLSNIDVGANSDLTFIDENGDGDLDLFIGASDGTIRVAHNQGTATNPNFAAPVIIRDLGNGSTPTFVDIDGDGDQDLFAGDTFGRIHYYRNRGSVNGASFAPPIINPFGISGGGGLANPDFVDIDGDGDRDLFVGTATGTTLFFRNTGTSTNPNFVRGDNNPFGLDAVVGAAAPNFVDVENDGDFDAFIGTSDGTTTYFVNVGTPTKPKFVNTSTSGFANGVSSDSSNTLTSFQLPNPLPDVGTNATPVLADINANGFLDAFIGESDGTINFINRFVQGSAYPMTANVGDELLDGGVKSNLRVSSESAEQFVISDSSGMNVMSDLELGNNSLTPSPGLSSNQLRLTQNWLPTNEVLSVTSGTATHFVPESFV